MEPFDDHTDEMGRGLTFDQAEAALTGQVPAGADPAVTDAAAVVAGLRQSLLVEPPPSVADRHLAAMLAARPVAPSPLAPAEVRPSLRTRVLRWAAVAGIAGGVTLSGGLAAAGNLPGPLQDRVSGAAGWLGIDLPRSSPPEPVPAAEPDQQDPPATHGDAVTEAVEGSGTGRERGEEVSGTADPFDRGGHTPPVDSPPAAGGATGPARAPAGPPAALPDDVPSEHPTAGRPPDRPAGDAGDGERPADTPPEGGAERAPDPPGRP